MGDSVSIPQYWKCDECDLVLKQGPEVQAHIKIHLDRKFSTRLTQYDRVFLEKCGIKPWKGE